MRRLLDLLVYGRRRDLLTIAHAPVGGEDEEARARRARKLMDARQRLGRAFKCAGADQDREVYVAPDTVRLVRAGYVARSIAANPATNVEKLATARRR